jgi:glycosyltransferase involved in cell wall biosynthesis
MRVVICWTGVAGYLAACWRALASRPDVALKIITFDEFGTANAPFGKNVNEGLDCQPLGQDRFADIEYVASIVGAYQPDAVVIPGWISSAYNRLPFHPSFKSCKFVMASDTPRRDTLRQRLARLKIGRLLDRMDAVIVSGERAWQLGRLLRVPEYKLRRGMNGIDHTLFENVHARRLARPDGWPKQFLYVGRYAPLKGVDLLAEGYKQYRDAVLDPWPLVCCGRGEMEKHFWGVSGLEDRGFVQPIDQPAVYESAGVFILPSRHEHWGVVIAEAGYCGLPIICTEECGGAVELVRSYHNGLTIPSRNASAIARGMVWAHAHYHRLPEMGARSRELSSAYTAERWADRWSEMFRDVLGKNDLPKHKKSPETIAARSESA